MIETTFYDDNRKEGYFIHTLNQKWRLTLINNLMARITLNKIIQYQLRSFGINAKRVEETRLVIFIQHDIMINYDQYFSILIENKNQN